MYTASKRYLAATISALTFAIVFVLGVIIARSSTPEIATDVSDFRVELKKALPP